MSTPAALAQARAEAATAARETAEQVLAEAMREIEPFTGQVSHLVATRRWESRLEHPRAPRALADAYSAYRRTWRAEIKAKSAAHAARWATATVRPPVRRARRPKITMADVMELTE